MTCAQVATADKEVIITNDGATILNKMRVAQPAAKMLVELSKSQARLREGVRAFRDGGRAVLVA